MASGKLAQHILEAIKADGVLAKYIVDVQVRSDATGIVSGADPKEFCGSDPGSGDYVLYVSGAPPARMKGLNQVGTGGGARTLVAYVVANEKTNSVTICRISTYTRGSNVAADNAVKPLLNCDIMIGFGKRTLELGDPNAIINVRILRPKDTPTDLQLRAYYFSKTVPELVQGGFDAIWEAAKNGPGPALPSKESAQVSRKAASVEAKSPLATVVATPIRTLSTVRYRDIIEARGKEEEYLGYPAVQEIAQAEPYPFVGYPKAGGDVPPPPAPKSVSPIRTLSTIPFKKVIEARGGEESPPPPIPSVSADKLAAVSDVGTQAIAKPLEAPPKDVTDMSNNSKLSMIRKFQEDAVTWLDSFGVTFQSSQKEVTPDVQKSLYALADGGKDLVQRSTAAADALNELRESGEFYEQNMAVILGAITRMPNLMVYLPTQTMQALIQAYIVQIAVSTQYGEKTVADFYKKDTPEKNALLDAMATLTTQAADILVKREQLGIEYNLFMGWESAAEYRASTERTMKSAELAFEEYEARWKEWEADIERMLEEIIPPQSVEPVAVAVAAAVEATVEAKAVAAAVNEEVKAAGDLAGPAGAAAQKEAAANVQRAVANAKAVVAQAKALPARPRAAVNTYIERLEGVREMAKGANSALSRIAINRGARPPGAGPRSLAELRKEAEATRDLIGRIAAENSADIAKMSAAHVLSTSSPVPPLPPPPALASVVKQEVPYAGFKYAVKPEVPSATVKPEPGCGSCQKGNVRVNDRRKDCYCGNKNPPPDGRPYCSRLKCFHKGYGAGHH